MIMNEEFTLAAGDNITEVANGTGPFYLVSNQLGDRVDLNAFPDYYRGIAEARQVTLRSIPDFGTQLMAFEAGELSFVNVPPADAEHIIESGRFTMYVTPTAQVFYAIMNLENAPFDDVRVRQAINYATNRRAHVIIARDGQAFEAFTMANPSIIVESVMPDHIFEHNVERAIELLAEAGFPNGFNIDSNIKVPAGIGMDSSAQVLQEDLSRIGITANIDVVELNSYIADLMSGNFDIGVMAVTLLPSHMQFFNQIFHSDFINNLNMARYSNPRVDELFELAATTVDDALRQQMYAEIVNIVNMDSVYVPLNFGINNWAFQQGMYLRYSAVTFEFFDIYFG
jgi:peptide/nickel transport system substrate-binding protein